MAKNCTLNDTDDISWVFDSLVGFLHGPIWNVPLQTFIEEKSLPFEPADDGGVHDKPEYKIIHNEYRNLVDMMLGSFMEDLGINADQFEQACLLSRRELEGLPAQFHRRLFRQVWAANDYDMFVKMMTHKNVELQLQALELIERRFGMTPNLLTQDGGDSSLSRRGSDVIWSDKDDVMNIVTQMQQLESSDEEDVVKATSPPYVAVEKKILKNKLHLVEDIEGGPQVQSATTVAPETVVTLAPDLKGLQSTEHPAEHVANKQKVSAEELRERQEYLKRQRDKLVALKREARVSQLAAGAARTRPASARAAQAVLAGRVAASEPAASVSQTRRALVDRLKAEVVNNKQ